MVDQPIDFRRKPHNGYRNGHDPAQLPGDPDDILLSTKAVIEAGRWRRLPPEARRLLCEAQRAQAHDITPVSDMIAATDAQAQATVDAVNELWKIINPAGAVPVVPELHPARLEDLLRYRPLNPDQRQEDAEQSAIRLGGMSAEEYRDKAAASADKTEDGLRWHYPMLAQALISSIGL